MGSSVLVAVQVTNAGEPTCTVAGLHTMVTLEHCTVDGVGIVAMQVPGSFSSVRSGQVKGLTQLLSNSDTVVLLLLVTARSGLPS